MLRNIKLELSNARRIGLPKGEIRQLKHFYYLLTSQKAETTQNEASTPIISQPAPCPVRPPLKAEYLLFLFLGKEERDIVIGDLVECYSRVVRKFGKRRGDWWFYKQVAGSLWPLFRRAVLKIGALVWIGRVLRRLIS
jgi:hypothetical protein